MLIYRVGFSRYGYNKARKSARFVSLSDLPSSARKDERLVRTRMLALMQLPLPDHPRFEPGRGLARWKCRRALTMSTAFGHTAYAAAPEQKHNIKVLPISGSVQHSQLAHSL